MITRIDIMWVITAMAAAMLLAMITIGHAQSRFCTSTKVGDTTYTYCT